MQNAGLIRRTLLSISVSENTRREIKIEAIEQGLSMREYVQMILSRRHELLDKQPKR